MLRLFAERRAPGAFTVYGFAVAGVVLIADQSSKFWVLGMLNLDAGGPGSRIQVFDPWFNLTMVWNRGISFGLFQANSLVQRLVLVVVSLVIAGLLTHWMFQASRRLQATAFAMIIGGAIGNVIDRFSHGAVVDFLDFSGLYFPYVFNVADAAISLGVAVMILDMVLCRNR